MDPRPLTTADVDVLTASGLGVRLSAEHLNTRTALYEWAPESQRWVCLQSGLRVTHCTTEDGRGMLWRQPARRFEPCTCSKCLRRDA
jgi:hypothetical protein